MAEHQIFFEITGVLLLAGVLSLVTGMLKQPSIIAFILTGLVVGPLGFWHLKSPEVLSGLGEVGIALLLFTVGLELDVKRLKSLGKVALLTGLGQIVFTTICGFLIATALGLSMVSALYVAVALTFSSTVIVIKLIGEKREMQSLYARIVVGFLIVQDFAALGILLMLGGNHQPAWLTSLPMWQVVLLELVKGLCFFGGLYFLSNKIFPKLLRYVGKSDELLLAASLAWALGLAALSSLPAVGLSIETGAFLAGLTLANTAAHFEIAGRVRSIRDFFLIMFFIVFGTQLVLTATAAVILPAIILSAFVLVGNPIIMMLIMGYLGYKPRTSFFSAMTVAQVSEFSFILVALGYRLGHVPSNVVSIVTLVGLITIAGSSYLILYSKQLYKFFRVPLQAFDFKRPHAAEREFSGDDLKKHTVLIGAHRLGGELLTALSELPEPLVVVDFDPEIVHQLEAKGFRTVLGDATDEYILEQVNATEADLIVSTIPDHEANMELIAQVQRLTVGRKRHPRLVIAAQSETEARTLYEHNADYAISPHFVGGRHLANILAGGTTTKDLHKLRSEHLKALEI